MMPIVEDVAVRTEAAVYQVDVDQSPALAQEYAPDGFPTFVLFKNGQSIESLTGEQSEERLLALVQ